MSSSRSGLTTSIIATRREPAARPGILPCALLVVALAGTLGHGADALAAAQLDWAVNSPANLVAEFGCDQSRAERRAMVVDAEGNSYLAGCKRNATGQGDGLVTLKYGPNGNLLWQNVHRNAANVQDLGFALALHPAGGVVVSGLSLRNAGGPSLHLTTIRVGANGALAWARDVPSAESIPALAVDAVGNVFVGTAVTGSGNTDYRVVKYAADGTQAWLRDHAGAGNGDDSVIAMTPRADGSIHVTGSITGSNGRLNITTLTYAANGTLLWAQTYPSGARNDLASQIALDRDGNIVVTGSSRGSGDDSNILVLKYTNTGALLWDRRFDGNAGLHEDTASDMVIGHEGQIAVTGRTSNSGGWNYGTFLIAPTGNLLWMRQYNGENDPGGDGVFDGARSLTIDVAGNVYVTGESESRTFDKGRQIATVAYSADGNLSWVHRYGGVDYSDSIGGAIAVAPDGSLRVAGNETDADDNVRMVLLKLQSRGDNLFANGFEQP